MHKVIFVSGGTGFLGGYIIQQLIDRGYEIVATKRSTSGFNRAIFNTKTIQWVDIDTDDCEEKVLKAKPSVFIHAAWEGVTSVERDDWSIQTKNILFFQKVLSWFELCKGASFIGIGSQAEYGFHSGLVKETDDIQPSSAYGAAKVICSELLKKSALKRQFLWFWVRLFATYGPYESDKWLIPSTVSKLVTLKDGTIDFSKAEQLVSYLHVSDAAAAIIELLKQQENGVSGFYNLCGKNILPLKELILNLFEIAKVDRKYANFGVLNKGAAKPRNITGDVEKLFTLIGEIEKITLKSGLSETFEFYKKKFRNESF